MRLEVDLRDRVAAELGDCERVQSWRPTAVRSSWTPELRAVLAALDTGDLDATVTAVAAAEARAVELATVVAHRVASDVEGLRARVHDVALDADTATATRWAAIAEADTVGELVELVRRWGWHLDDGQHGRRDGWVIDDGRAVAYATARTFDPSRLPGVEVDLDTGEVRRSD